MTTVYANGRSIVHKGDGKTNIAAPPDVCKTPSPGGPVPVPYVNIARTSDLSEGSKKVKIEGNPIGLESSNISSSSGDEPGSAGGIISSKTKGKMTWSSCSLDVKVEGKGVVRFMDTTLHNGNICNVVFMENGETKVWSYGDEEDTCVLCGKPESEHNKAEESDGTKAKADELGEALRAQEAFRHDGYMTAVAMCGCHSDVQVYAYSGKAGVDGFEDAASGLSGKWILANEPVHPSNFHNFKGKAQKDREELEKVMRLWKWGSEMHQNTREGKTKERFQPPGQCAGPKAINKAHQVGLEPRHLTEQWFATQAGGVMKDLMVYEEKRGDEVVEKREVFKDGDTVPSCGTCKVVIMAMLCSAEEPECSGG